MINTVLEAYLQAVLSLSQVINDDDKQQGKECAGEDIEYPLQPIEESKHLYSEEDDTINKSKQKREVNVFTRSHRVDGRLKVVLAVALCKHEHTLHDAGDIRPEPETCSCLQALFCLYVLTVEQQA